MVGESRNEDGSNPMESRQSFDMIFDQLSHPRRRCALACLLEKRGRISLADLAEEVAIREQEVPITEISAEEVREVETTLYHWHIPKLAEAGVVEYDLERALVQLAEGTEQIERFVALTPSGA